MLNIIQNNPYRFLGVYSNSPVKERVSNGNRLKAFLKVQKETNFPLELNNLIPPLMRSLDGLTAANNSINLPKDQLKFALFWFVKASPIDGVALGHLLNGNTDKAIEVFSKKDDFSSLINRGVIAFIKDNNGEAIQCVSKVIHNPNYRRSLLDAVCDSTFKIDENELAHLFMDSLLEEIPVKQLTRLFEQFGISPTDNTYLKENSVGQLVENINKAVAEAKNVKSEDWKKQYEAGTKLMNSTKEDLQTVRSILGASDMQYQMIADNLAKQILQCGINYYNNTSEDESESVNKAMVLQNYALSIAVGKLTKDRCQENADILKKKKENLPPPKVKEEANNIFRYLTEYCKLPDKISHAITLLNNTKPLLRTMCNKLGASNSYYLNLSSIVVGNALHNVIEEINALLSDSSLLAGVRFGYSSAIESFRSTLNSGLLAMNMMGEMDMDYNTRKRYNENKSTLQDMCNKVNPQPQPSSGCYIATMVYGDYDHPQVMVLRHFRDNVLSKYSLGRAFIRFYYKYSPGWVEKLRNKKTINHVIRCILDKFIKIYKR